MCVLIPCNWPRSSVIADGSSASRTLSNFCPIVFASSPRVSCPICVFARSRCDDVIILVRRLIIIGGVTVRLRAFCGQGGGSRIYGTWQVLVFARSIKSYSLSLLAGGVGCCHRVYRSVSIFVWRGSCPSWLAFSECLVVYVSHVCTKNQLCFYVF